MRRCACIDIGSNTTRLLVAEDREGVLTEVVATRAFTRLGAGREPGDPIPEERIGITARTVAEQVRLAREHGADHVSVVATAAIRTASNRAALCAAVREQAGVAVSVLSPEEEAAYAFAGATGTLECTVQAGATVAVVDVGGGSSELVCGTPAEGVAWAASLPVGSGVLADRHLRGARPSPAAIAAVRADAAEAFAGLRPPTPTPTSAFAVGGSATSLRRFLGPELTVAALAAALDLLCDVPVEEVARRFDLHAERARLLPAGIAVLEQAVAVLQMPLQICRGGLREGIILEGMHGQGT